jgi:hypothetical protein
MRRATEVEVKAYTMLGGKMTAVVESLNEMKKDFELEDAQCKTT